MPKYKSSFQGTPDAKEFAKDYFKLIRKWTPRRVAEALGVAPQSIDYYIRKEEREENL